MKNFILPGNNITVIAPAGGVTSGQLVIIGAIVGVASCTAAAGAQVELAVEGVYDLAKVPADALPAGAVAKVATGSNVIAAAGTLGIGWVVQAAAAGAATARVRLVPSVASPPTVLMETHGTHAAKHEHEPVGAGRRG